MNEDTGASASQTGPSQAEPVVSAVPASVPCAATVHKAAIRWCGRKDRETFPDDVIYFERNWRWALGLRAVVDEVVAEEANDAMFEALKRLNGWLDNVAECDIDEVVADGGITAAMVVRQEAREQQRRVRNVLAQAIALRAYLKEQSDD